MSNFTRKMIDKKKQHRRNPNQEFESMHIEHKKKLALKKDKTSKYKKVYFNDEEV